MLYRTLLVFFHNECASYVLCVLFRFYVFCSLAVLDPRVGHTMDVLSPFVSVLCHSDWLFHGKSPPRLDVVDPGRVWSSLPACTWHCSLRYLLDSFSTYFLVSSWCDHCMLVSLLWQCLASSFFYSSFVKNPPSCFLCCPWNPRILSQSFYLKGVNVFFSFFLSF